MKRRGVLVVIVTILVLVAAVIVLNLTLRGSRYETAIPVRAYLVNRGSLQDRVSGNGTFVPKDAFTVTSQVSAEVRSIRVAENDRVQAGDVLLKLRDDDSVLAAQKMRASLDATRKSIRQSLVTLRAQFRSATSAVSDAQRTFSKSKELFAAKAVSQESYQQASDAVDTAQVNLQSAREQLDLRCGLPLDATPPLDATQDDKIIEASPEVEQALLSLQSAQDTVTRCTITAPAAGVVTDVKPSVGDQVSPSTPLVKIETLDDMLARIQIDEVDIGKIRVGQPAEITSDSLIGLTLTGTVDTISPVITSVGSTRVSMVDVKVDPASRKTSDGSATLRSGASCTARIVTSIKENVLLVPLSSFVTEENVTTVYLLQPTGKKNAAQADIYQLARREIGTGSSDVNSIEVTKGLAEGDRIVAGNLKLIREGILVTVRQD